MNKVVITTISSVMAILMLTAMMANPVIASINEEEEELDREDYDARNDYTIDECAEMFDPYYDREGFLTCSGGIGIPNPGP